MTTKNPMHFAPRLLLAAAVTAGLSACGKDAGMDVQPSPAGTVVLAATSSPADSEPLYDAWKKFNGGETWVLVTSRLQEFGGTDSRVLVMQGQEQAADERELPLCGGAIPDQAAAVMLSHTGAWIGGEAASCVQTTPPAKDALRALHGQGVVTGADGDGAALTGLFTVYGTPSEEAVAEGWSELPPDGIGLLNNMIVAAGPDAETRLGAVATGLADTGLEYGLVLPDNSAVTVDLGQGRMYAAGTDPMYLIELADADWSDRSRTLRNARISMLCPGDTYDFNTQSTRFVAGKSQASSNKTRALPEAPDAWAPGMVPRMIRTLADADRNIPFTARSTWQGEATHRLMLTRDDTTLLFRTIGEDADPDSPTYYTVIRARMDILPIDD